MTDGTSSGTGGRRLTEPGDLAELREGRTARRGPVLADLSVAPVPRISLTPPEAAAAVGCSAEYFREHIDGELRWVRRARKRFVLVSELTSWLERLSARLPA